MQNAETKLDGVTKHHRMFLKWGHYGGFFQTVDFCTLCAMDGMSLFQTVHWSGGFPVYREWLTTGDGEFSSVDSYFEVRYEDLVLHPESTLRKICQFLDVQFSPQMLEYHRSGRDELPNKSLRWHQNSVRAPDPALVGQWKQKMSISDRTIFEELAGDALKTFGYETEKLSTTKLSRAKEIYYAIRRW